MTRDSYFDILRGIAILLVIAIHTYPGGDCRRFCQYMLKGML